MAQRKSTKTPTRTRAKKLEDFQGPELDWLESVLKRKRFSHENLHDIVVEILREVRVLRKDIDRLLAR